MKNQGFILVSLLLCLGASFSSPAATFTVTSTADSGVGTLRQALLDANANPGADIIDFAIGNGGARTNAPTTALPTITDPVTIDGTTQAPTFGGPPIVLDGNSAPASTDGLKIATTNCVIRGLVFQRWKQDAIDISGGQGHVIEGCYIGVDITGNVDLGSTVNGITILNSSSNIIGGATTAARNIISGNNVSGIQISGGSSLGNQILGNIIGLSAAGTVPIANLLHGIHLNGATSTVVGGSAAGERNIISGNSGAGIMIQSSTATGNLIRGNYIGSDLTGTSDLGNATDGIQINAAGGNTIGGALAGEGNLILGNNSEGIEINTAGSTNNLIRGNTITLNSSDGILLTSTAGTNNAIRANSIFLNTGLGIDLDPNNANANDAQDIDIGPNLRQNYPVLTTAAVNASDTQVTGTLNSTANTTYEIDFFSNTTIDGNGEGQQYLGSTMAATDASGNASFDVALSAAATGKFVTATATDPNGNTSEFSTGVNALSSLPGTTFTVTTTADTGAGSLRQAILDANATSTSNRIEFAIAGAGPHIISPVTALPGISNTVTIDGYTQPGAVGNTDAATFNGTLMIVLSGTNAPASTDLLSVQWPGVTIRGLNIVGSKQDGIEFTATSRRGAVEGCLIGVGLDNSDQGNAATGVNMVNSPDNRIGGATPVQRNVISGNNNAGVLIDQLGSQRNVVAGNLIGVAMDGVARLTNLVDGVRINLGANNTIGGAAPGARNIISGNTGEGIEILGVGATNNVILGNYIGTDVTGLINTRNTSHGVYVSLSSRWTKVGGAGAGEPNTIAFNGGDGVYIFQSTNNPVRGNSIHDNVGLGIDLENDGVTANDTGDADGGSNLRQNSPLLSSAIANAADTLVSGTLNSSTNAIMYIDFYSSPSLDATGSGEGAQHLGTWLITTDGSGNATFNITLPVAATGKYITATATDENGNTSEFSAGVGALMTAPGSTFTVTTTADSGVGSLRQSILDANNQFGSNRIVFAIPGDGPHVITTTTILPIIRSTVTIDGYTQPGATPNTSATAFNGVIKVVVAGPAAVVNYDGLFVEWTGVTIRGLAIIGFRGTASPGNVGSGIWLGPTSASCAIEGCLIGIGLDGTDQGNGNCGVYISGSAGHRVGGVLPAQRNVISGNNNIGVFIEGNAARNNLVVGNNIGTTLDGLGKIPNGQDGVRISAAGDNTIGGSAPGSRNVISGNGDAGVELTGTATTNNVVLGNYIGPDVTGAAGVTNTGPGVLILSGARGNTIGGLSAGAGNIIAFNNSDGVQISSTTAPLSTNNAIRANIIRFNGGLGIDLGSDGILANDIGDADAIANQGQNYPVLSAATATASSAQITGTLSSGTNTTYQIDFFSNTFADASGNGEGQQYLGSTSVTTDAGGVAAISANLPVGATGKFISATATDPLGNTSEFGPCVVGISSVSATTYVVTTTADSGAGSLRQAILDANQNFSAGDIISFNISGPGPHTNVVLTALPAITDPVTINGYSQTGAAANTSNGSFNGVLKIVLNGATAPNGTDGLAVQSPNVTIRGLNIVGFRGDGIELSSAASNFFIEGCLIGWTHDNARVGNGGHGINVNGGSNGRIGDAAAATHNVISGNSANGILLTGANSSNNVVAGNLIGLGLQGTEDGGNNTDGINIASGAHHNTIGGGAAGLRNFISGNGNDGVEINGAATLANRVLGNYIGATITTNQNNGAMGVNITTGAHDNQVGGLGAGEGNRISGNNQDGISITGNGTITTNNAVRANSIVANGNHGIDLANNGVTANDAGDVDGGPNYLQNFPVLTSAVANPASTRIVGTLNSLPNATYSLDFFSSLTMESDFVLEGDKYLGSGEVTTDGSGNGSFDITVPGVVNGRFITSTATDTNGNTSEFSAYVRTESTIAPPTLLVTTTNDSGAGSLRQALLDAGAYIASGPVNINFNINGAGPHMIAPATILPFPAEAVAINGYSQSGASANTLAIGNNAVIKIVLVGSNLFNATLRMTNSGNVISGLSIVDSKGEGLLLNSNSNRVEGCFFGLLPSGDAKANANYGIHIEPLGGFGGRANQIGGTAPAQRNVISGNANIGLYINGGSSNVVQGNYIGSNPAGNAERQNQTGIYLTGSPGAQIGGTVAGARNLISGNTFGGGISINDTAGTVVLGNYIGVDATGTNALPNSVGVYMGNASRSQIGGVAVAEANLIAFNTGPGVQINGFQTETNNTVRGNSIFNNGGLGIDLAFGGVTENDPQDVDGGGNRSQNFPTITTATAGPTGVTISGTLESAAVAQIYTLDFYANTVPDASGNGEGEQFLGSGFVTNDASGLGTFTVTLPTVVRGRYISATATDPNGNTSEFSDTFQAMTTFASESFAVVNTNDSGPGSLRDALERNNTSIGGGNNNITFNISGSTVIAPLTALPVITHAVTINGFSQPGSSPNSSSVGNSSVLRIQLEGTNIFGTALAIQAPGTILRGLSIVRFAIGVDIRASNVTVAGCWIGLRPDSSIGENSSYGILVFSGSDNTIGGTAPADRNVISGNTFGIFSESGAIGLKILGNYVGTNPAGAESRENDSAGMFLRGTNHIIGGSSESARNIISGNAQGIILNFAIDAKVLGNYIGVSASGLAAIPNRTSSALEIENQSRGNIVGGSAPGERNIISGNSVHGVVLDFGVFSNRVVGNYIGVGPTGDDMGNGGDGIIVSSDNNQIGGTTEAEGNVIAFNHLGVFINSNLATNNPIRKNRIYAHRDIGIDLSGNGVTLNDPTDADTGANSLQNFPIITNSVVGDTDVTIKGYLQSLPNQRYELEFFANFAADPTGFGEGEQYLGTAVVNTAADGRAEFSETFQKIATGRYISSTATDPNNNTSEFSAAFKAATTRAPRNFEVITKSDSGPGSLREILGQSGQFFASGPHKIRFNIPGAGAQIISLLTPLPASVEPVEIDGFTQPGAAANNAANTDNAVRLIHLNGAQLQDLNDNGLTLLTSGNIVRGLIISQFPFSGIQISSASNNVVESCLVISNRSFGINLDNASGNTIGGAQLSARNLIRANTSAGISISGPGTSNFIYGNFIGVDETGAAGQSNQNGVQVNADGNAIIGGVDPGQANWISFNNRGVLIQGGTGTRIRGNRITANTALGIDLSPTGITANDALDADTGANNRQNYPIITTANITTSGFHLIGTLNSAASAAFAIDFYWNAACDTVNGNGEGQQYIGSTTVNTDSSGNASFDVSFPSQYPRGVVTATATDSANNTSEFSACRAIGTEVPPQTFAVTSAADSGPGTLRQAILDSNNAFTTGPNPINFNIPGSGIRIISPATPLPAVTSPATLNAFTQPGAQLNSSATVINAVLLIRLDGQNAGDGADGLFIQASNTTVRGFIVTGFSGAGIHVANAADVLVTENFIGSDVPTAPLAQSILNKFDKKQTLAQAPPAVVGNDTGILLENTTRFSTLPPAPNSFGGAILNNNTGILVVNDSNTIITDTTILNNRALPEEPFAGGGIFSEGSQSLTIERCTLEGNRAYDIRATRGNASNSGNLVIRNCKVKGKKRNASDRGGGISVDRQGIQEIRDNSIEEIPGDGLVVSQQFGPGLRIFTGNLIQNCEGTGLVLEDVSNVTVGGNAPGQANTIKRNKRGGARARGASTRIAHNHFQPLGAYTSGSSSPSQQRPAPTLTVLQSNGWITQGSTPASPGSSGEFVFSAFNQADGVMDPIGTFPVTVGPNGVASYEARFPNPGPTFGLFGVFYVDQNGNTSELGLGVQNSGGNASVTKTLIGGPSFPNNSEMEFEITIRNTSPQPNAPAVVWVNDLLPDGLLFVDSTVVTGNAVNTIAFPDFLTARVGAIFGDGGDTRTVRIKTLPFLLGPFDNEAEIVRVSGGNSNTADDSSIASGVVTPTIAGVDNSFTYTMSDNSVLPSSRTHFVFDFFNRGTSPSTLTDFIVDLGPGVTPLSPHQDFTTGPNRITYHLGTIPAGGSFPFYLDLSAVDPGTKTFTFTVVQAETDANSANNTAGGSFVVPTFGFDDLFDFGDAPDSYQTTVIANGARHHIAAGPSLGTLLDIDANGSPSPQALGDDLAGDDDEDAVIFRSPLVAGLLATVDIQANGTPGQMFLDMWIDYNGDGDFTDGSKPGEPWEYVAGIIENHPDPLSKLASYPLVPGLNRIRFFVPNTHYRAVPTFARFRISKTGKLNPFGPANEGEVEDHYVQMFDLLPDFGDAPDSEKQPQYPTLLAHNGAVHLSAQAGFQLGQRLDFEPNGFPSLDALGDDQDNGLEFPQSDNPDDEDGVTIPSTLAPGQVATINVFATIDVPGPAKLDAWIDYNGDFDWSDPGEKIINSGNLIAGNNPFQITVPANAKIGQTYARFRMSNNGNLQPFGAASTGEVEDYMVTIGGVKLLYTYINRQLTLSWTGNFKLQEASAPLHNLFNTLEGAPNPYPVTTTGTQKYYRLIAAP